MTPIELFSNSQGDFVPKIANFAMDMVAHMWQRSFACSQPDFRLRASIERILHTSGVSPSVLLLALKYIQRVTKNPQIRISGYERQLFVVAVILAHKVLEDDTYTNSSWSHISGISVSELTSFEQSFLFAIGFDLFVSEIEFTQWLLYAKQYLRYSKSGPAALKMEPPTEELASVRKQVGAPKSWWRYPSILGVKESRTPSSVV
ncbi:hypothetical protein K493DRAFT_302817 [Basidiobolus meristosporus CBS 931.73]|uniref:Cyclin N-terminal domain-containing protein n=1 Tax=Basidiobolus meristosporus CBS 931.73 TaxID=1314790 RepID=A0A1Y1Y5L9_9FUNG|nr:hypothetical protein K493DRAFT_302817 [Basidiobolus meristosporus CBS 931.73]|eukprot:ORX93185.1 hypothetical protein K493DRAFT_302817 [Basidiobolus meristosporus CBS 931.73]